MSSSKPTVYSYSRCQTCDDTGWVYPRLRRSPSWYEPDELEFLPCHPDDEGAIPCEVADDGGHPMCLACGDSVTEERGAFLIWAPDEPLALCIDRTCADFAIESDAQSEFPTEVAALLTAVEEALK